MLRRDPEQLGHLLLGHGEHADLERLQVHLPAALAPRIVQGDGTSRQGAHLDVTHLRAV